MNITVYLPLLAALVIGTVGPAVARHAPPAAGAAALAWLSLVAAAGSTWALALLALTLVDDVRIGVSAPVPDIVAMVAAMSIGAAAARLAVVGRHRRHLHRRIRAATPDGSPVVVLADARPDAFVVPARRHPLASRRRAARIVVTDGMMRALDNPQRRALFAHEQAHLDRGHHWLRVATEIAAALNPLLIPARRTVAYLCEREADERAAVEVGDRGVVAAAVATAALAGAAAGYPRHGVALAFDRLGVVDRVAALNRPAATHPRLVGLAAVMASVAIVAADALATGECGTVIRALLPG